MENRKISIDTPLGRLCACADADPNYPGIFVYVERADGIKIDLVVFEVNVASKEAKAYLYGDTSAEGWTERHRWSEADINISYD